MENSQITVSQKSNHVSSVLLYGVPIVSLFIEGQERLCLAQISNTLLKQFSYNEIHNRRVALGITCVQCTPVQLEILRRAGAMPVSSRRCGMITRREAERLCKSFLGDNTPPRLPDDFAFNVQHKCAWGCRGSFLPSRYNSSRAKCIKCTYCGMFFSPNKFIFHSHRITTNDRYIQPDAANFNSWRRHMTLCGHGQNEKIIHAWEDVKAMFNGGTRKRLVSCNNNNHNSTSINRNRNTIPEKSNAIMENECISAVSCETDIKTISLREESSASIQRSLDHSYNYNTVAAGTAVVGVTAVAATVGVPFNLQRSSVLSPLQSLRNEHDLSMMPISRNFVVDYTMWQQQQTNSQHTNKKTNDNETMNGFETCTIPPWIRPETNVSTSAPKNAIRLMEHQPFNIIKSESNNTSICGILKSRQNPDSATCVNHSDFDIPSILSSSAFKPVVSAAAIVSTSLYTTRSNDSNGNVYISPPHTHPTRTTTLFTHNSVKAAATHRLATSEAIFNSSSSSFPPLLLDSIQQLRPESSEQSVSSTTLVDGFNDHSLVLTQTENADKSPLSSDPIYIESRNCQNEDDDDEVVDIETTEEDIVCPSYSTADILSLSASHSLSGSPNDDVDVDGLTTDTEDQSDLKSSICSYDINITRSNFKSCTNEREKNSALNSAYAEQLEKYKKTNIEDANGLKGLSRRKCSSQHKSRLCLKNNVTKLQDDSILTSQPSLHIQQRVSFPVFLKSHLNSFRQRQRRQPSSSYVCMTQHPEIKETSLTK